jgi:hypothetical protein
MKNNGNNFFLVFLVVFAAVVPAALFADSENTHTPMDPEDEIADGDWSWNGNYRKPVRIMNLSLFRDGIFSGYDSRGNLACLGMWDITEAGGEFNLEMHYQKLDNFSSYSDFFRLIPHSEKEKLTLILQYSRVNGKKVTEDAGKEVYLLPAYHWETAGS